MFYHGILSYPLLILFYSHNHFTLKCNKGFTTDWIGHKGWYRCFCLELMWGDSIWKGGDKQHAPIWCAFMCIFVHIQTHACIHWCIHSLQIIITRKTTIASRGSILMKTTMLKYGSSDCHWLEVHSLLMSQHTKEAMITIWSRSDTSRFFSNISFFFGPQVFFFWLLKFFLLT